MKISGKSFFCSWSGGKDSCLAFYRSVQNGGIPCLLLTMMNETGDRSRSHGLPLELLEKQALALNLPFWTRAAGWSDYESVFVKALTELKNQKGIPAGVFGDIDLEPHREWVEKVCSRTGIEPFEPLWNEARSDLLDEFIGLGFKAVVVAVKDGVLGKEFLGKTLDPEIITKFKGIGIDPSGEKGEYHTVVVDGPNFGFPIRIELREQVFFDGYWFQDVSVAI